jgi:hypothetical protein
MVVVSPTIYGTGVSIPDRTIRVLGASSDTGDLVPRSDPRDEGSTSTGTGTWLLSLLDRIYHTDLT